jgi:hypothetical protein
MGTLGRSSHFDSEKISECVAAATEEAIYKALGMQTVPPELREGRDEIARALAGTLPKLVTDSDIARVLHAHTATDELEDKKLNVID